VNPPVAGRRGATRPAGAPPLAAVRPDPARGSSAILPLDSSGSPMRSLALRGLIACAFLASAACGLDPATPLQSYEAHGSRYSEGLPQMAVSAVAPSRDGYLWLGTRSGLVRFDGVRFTLVEGKGGVQALAAGADGWMWAGFLDGRLAGWRKGQRRALWE